MKIDNRIKFIAMMMMGVVLLTLAVFAISMADATTVLRALGAPVDTGFFPAHTGNIAGQLFLRSFERSDRVYNAMLARGYRGEFLTLNPHHLRSTDWIFAISALSFLSALLWVSHLNSLY